MKATTLERAALCLILGLCFCADGLGNTPSGMAVLLGGVAFSGLLIHLAYTRGCRTAHNAAKSAQTVPLDARRNRPAEDKKKAAAVVETPQRQVKQSSHANISHPHFTGAKGECQMENQKLPTAEELASILRNSLKTLVPEKNISMYASENYENGEVSFNLKIRYPSMDTLRPAH